MVGVLVEEIGEMNEVCEVMEYMIELLQQVCVVVEQVLCEGSDIYFGKYCYYMIYEYGFCIVGFNEDGVFGLL